MTIEERLEQVENTLVRVKRRNRWLVLVVLLVAGTWITFAGFTGDAEAQIGRQVPKTIRASAFELVDETGRTRAEMSMFKDGPGLYLYDEKGEVRVGLRVSKDGSILSLSDEKGIMGGGAELVVTKAGPSLHLFDKKGTIRASLGCTKTVTKATGATHVSAESTLTLFDKEGTVLLRLPRSR